MVHARAYTTYYAAPAACDIDDHDRFIYCIIMLGGPCMMITNDKTLGCIKQAVNEGSPAPPFRNSTIRSLYTWAICFPSLVSGVTHHHERLARSFIRLRFHSCTPFVWIVVSQHSGIELAFGLDVPRVQVTWTDDADDSVDA